LVTTARKSFLENPRIAFGVLAGYFLLHLILRTLISGSMQTDEAEQSFVAQVWLWGYGSQPPLYTWLQIPLFSVFGVGVFALALLKNTLLFGVYLFTYLTGRELFHDSRSALLATFSLLLIVLFAWESQRDQTHLVLATAIAAATVYTFVRLHKSPTIGWYCLLGGLAGLGVLAKYNYAVLIASLLPAAVSLPATRPAVFTRRMFPALVCFLLVLAPHAGWAWTNPERLMSQSNKFNIPISGDFVMASLKGGALLVKRIVDFTIVLAAVYGLIAFRAPRNSPPAADRTLVILLTRTLLIGLGLCLLLVLVFQVTAIRARWLQPLLISLPLVLVGWLQPRLNQRRVNFIFALAALVLLVIPTVMYGRVATAAWARHPTNLNVPYRAFAEQIRASGFSKGAIICDGHLVAGNLRPWFRDCPILVPGNIPIPISSADELPVLLTWHSEDQLKIPGTLVTLATDIFQVDSNQFVLQTAAAPAWYAPAVTEKLHFAWLPAHGTHKNAATPPDSANQ